MLPRHSIAAGALACVASLAVAQCGDERRAGLTASVHQAIVSGDLVTAADSSVLYLTGPEGACSATLVAPTLVVTARHCVAQTQEGLFTCTPEGDLVVNGTGAGQIGPDDPPSSLSFYTNARFLAGTAFSGSPDAVGSQTISTNTMTSCRDDLALVVLDRPILGLAIAPVRIDTPTQLGEAVSLWGYGLTEHQNDPTALRVRYGAQIAGVGPDMPATTTQLAPLRAVRIGPDDITCAGDSGGPVTSASTGAVIAIASLGNEPDFSTPTCVNHGTPDTTGPRLAAYRDLVLSAFAAAGATPVLEHTALDGATPDDGASETGSIEGGGAPPDAGPPDPPATPTVAGGSCAVTADHVGSSTAAALLLLLLGATAAARGARRAARRFDRGRD